MKKLFFSLVAGLLISGLFLPATSMATDSTKDQANDAVVGTANLTLFTSSTTRAQTFSPTMNRLTQIDLYLKDRVNGSWVEIALINEPTAEVVATSGTRMGAGDGWQSIYFGDTTLDTNNVYRIKVYNQSSLNVKWTYNNTNPYTGGFLYSGPSTFDATSDLNFRTFGYNETSPGTETPPATPATPSTSPSASTTDSSEALGTTTASIAKPLNLTAAYSEADKGTKLTWKTSTTADIDGYKVFRSESQNSGYGKIAETTKTVLEAVDTNITAGKTYYYQVRAYKGTNQSISSNTATVKIPDSVPPAKPQKLQVVDKTDSMLKATWRRTEDATVTSYTINLYKGGEKIRTAELNASDELYSFFDLDASTLYKVELIAKNDKGLTSSPATTYGFTLFPEEYENIINSVRSLAAILVLILLLVLAFRTKKHYQKK